MAAAAEALANKTYKPLTQSLMRELKTNNEVTFLRHTYIGGTRRQQ